MIKGRKFAEFNVWCNVATCFVTTSASWQTELKINSHRAKGLALSEEGTEVWRWQVLASLYNSNKLTNQMQLFHKFITWCFVSLNMFRPSPRPSSGAYNCINPLNTKRRLLYIKTQSVPRCKHFLSRL